METKKTYERVEIAFKELIEQSILTVSGDVDHDGAWPWGESL